MKKIFAEFFVRILGPFHGRFMRALAYGPWGPIHQLIIQIFARIYGIEVPKNTSFKNLGDFFLRDISFANSSAELQSPVEATLIEGPAPLNFDGSFSVKGLSYCWDGIPEFPLKTLKPSARFWNLYLAPYNYHWVHAPCDGENLLIRIAPGRKWPVNRFGRFLCSQLYLENDRVTFSWDHPKFGKIVMICVGAMGVSSMRLANPQATSLKKGEKVLAFELGSTVLLIVENPPTSVKTKTLLKLADEL